MNTARPRTSALRTRILAGPQRVLLVALLVFAFLYSHGVSPDGVRGHTDTAVGVITPTADPVLAEGAPDDRHGGGHGASHAAEECATSQPQQPPTLSPPPGHDLLRILPSVLGASPDRYPGRAPAPGCSRPPGTTAILRI
ncbi:hypothetical protein AW27_003285 [Streptomyces sp. PCS3-D2]|uniref:hypothetical protein n=1 Tax=Streptomyces sp. PCS3-D2 TaxID=1460244 RepID=UPI00272CD5A8|nr:hypothetical protein [Streptomyces sp. PCS3-D2]WKV70628.1 hypothetical protein AW27_003285 [Streptomyces sp. PCS3-D2]